MFKRLIRRFKLRWLAWWSRRSASTRTLPGYLWRALFNYLRYGARQAAALAYFALFSVFPLTLLLAVGLSRLAGPAVAQEQIAEGLALFLPERTVTEMQTTLQSALEQGTEFSVVASLGLIWSALGLFSHLTMALDFIFDVPSMRSIWRQRLLAGLMSLTLVVLVLTSFLTSGVLRLVSVFLLDQPSIWLDIGRLFLPLGLDLAIFALLFRYVPARRVLWDAVWPAAMFGAVGWEFAKEAFEWYLTDLANYSVIYGSIATVIVLLFWAYVIASILMFSAELCARLNEWLLAEKERQADIRREQRDTAYLYYHGLARNTGTRDEQQNALPDNT